MNQEMTRRPLIAAATTLGIAMGGFIGGIVLHQLLQVHNMLSAKYPTKGIPLAELAVNLEINMFWDDLFHVMTWLMTAVGLAQLWHAVRQPNVALSTKTAFLASGVIMIVGGWLTIGSRAHADFERRL